MFSGPIFSRELLTTSRRPLHYVLRATYLGLLFVLLWTVWQLMIGFRKEPRLSEIAHFEQFLFPILSYTQLGLVLFTASLYGASTISHEKDRRTFILLLLSRLEDREIVIEKFLCGFLQIGALLLVALPVFLLTALFGGVGFERIGHVFAVTFATAMLSAAIGVLISVWKEKTFQSVSLTIMTIVFGLLLVEVLAAIGAGVFLAGRPISLWCACLSPFRAIATIIGSGSPDDRVIPLFGDVYLGYLAFSLFLCSICLAFAVVKLRVWNPGGEPIQQRETFGKETEATGAEPDEGNGRKYRQVWSNPILWREIATRAYGPNPILIKLGYLVICAILFAGLYRYQELLVWLVGGLSILSLLLVNAQAATAVTSERDLKSIDLLLVTDLSAKEFIYGKLFGILYNTWQMIVAPLVFLLLCRGWGLIGVRGFFFISICFLVFVLFSAVLGIHAALRYQSTRVSLAHSLGTMFLLFVGILLCLYLIQVSGRFEAQWSSFIVFIFFGSIGLWISLSANAPSNAIGLTATVTPVATFYCVVAFLQNDQVGPFLVGSGVYGFAVLAMLIPLLSEFDVATGRTSSEEG